MVRELTDLVMFLVLKSESEKFTFYGIETNGTARKLNFYDTGELMGCQLDKEEMVSISVGNFKVEAQSFYKNDLHKGCGFKNARVFSMKLGNIPGRDIILYSTSYKGNF